jgi:hypothetical protein
MVSIVSAVSTVSTVSTVECCIQRLLSNGSYNEAPQEDCDIRGEKLLIRRLSVVETKAVKGLEATFVVHFLAQQG